MKLRFNFRTVPLKIQTGLRLPHCYTRPLSLTVAPSKKKKQPACHRDRTKTLQAGRIMTRMLIENMVWQHSSDSKNKQTLNPVILGVVQPAQSQPVRLVQRRNWLALASPLYQCAFKHTNNVYCECGVTCEKRASRWIMIVLPLKSSIMVHTKRHARKKKRLFSEVLLGFFLLNRRRVLLVLLLLSLPAATPQAQRYSSPKIL